MTREEMKAQDAMLQARIKELIAEAPSVSIASIVMRFAVPLAWCGAVMAAVNLFS